MLKNENAYRTITEVADLLQVPASVLRFWETQFHQIKPVKRMGRRYYQAEDVVLLARIRDYLYKEGFTIKGVQKRLKGSPREGEEGGDLFSNVPSIASMPADGLIKELGELKEFIADHL